MANNSSKRTINHQLQKMKNCTLVFYPNACHVCKAYGQEVTLKRCGNCLMISYCSKDHQKQHWPQHKPLCTVIYSITKKDGRQTKNLTAEDWIKWKINFMFTVGFGRSGKLERYEKQMFQFHRACTVCHDTNPEVLIDCLDCPCASFCHEHKNDPQHKEVCSALKTTFNLDLVACNYEPEAFSLISPSETDQPTLPDNMKNFLRNYIERNESSKLSLEDKSIMFSQYLARPLTMLFAMKKLLWHTEKESICIHVVGADITEMKEIKTWKILLHWIPDLLSVKLKLIGPEIYGDTFNINLYNIPILPKKYISVESISDVYENYATSSYFIAPDFIVAYNAGIHVAGEKYYEHYTWPAALKIIAKQNCPFIVTTNSKIEAVREKDKLQLIFGNDVQPFCFEQNPFSSLRPHRDTDTEGVFYRNHYIIIYKRLSESL